jgi:uncharacterized alkaline shock family protein YloU
MTGPAQVSPDVLARYAADAVVDAAGVRGLVGDRMRRHGGVRVIGDGESVTLEVHVSVASGTPIPDVARGVQQRVAEYLERMAGTRPDAVDVVVHDIEA